MSRETSLRNIYGFLVAIQNELNNITHQTQVAPAADTSLQTTDPQVQGSLLSYFSAFFYSHQKNPEPYNTHSQLIVEENSPEICLGKALLNCIDLLNGVLNDKTIDYDNLTSDQAIVYEEINSSAMECLNLAKNLKGLTPYNIFQLQSNLMVLSLQNRPDIGFHMV